MAIKAYSYAKDGNRKLSANFAVKEFRCKDGSDPIFIDDELVTLLQKIRDHFGKSVTITSAYRTAAHNKAVKGATYSQHCYGKAADIDDFCRKAQLLNIESNQALYEGWLDHMWEDASGIMTWMGQSAYPCLLYTSPSPRDGLLSRMPSSA